jgi:GntR family transcriptional regulator
MRELKDTKLPEPLLARAYQRARQAIRTMAEGPDYSPGDKIPSERALSESMGLSRMTVRKALEDLVREGVLERRSTSGTHVAAPKVLRPLDAKNVLGISQIVRNAGGKPGSRLLFFESAKASEHLSRHLDVGVGAPLVVIRRLQTSDGVPFAVEKNYLSAERVPGLVAADIIEGQSLYTVLSARYGIKVSTSRGFVGIAPVNDDDAHLLDLQPGLNVLVYRAVVFDDAGRPVEHTVSVNHPTRVLFATDYPFVVNAPEDAAP